MGLAWFKHKMTDCSDVVTIMVCTGEKEWLVKQEKVLYRTEFSLTPRMTKFTT